MGLNVRAEERSIVEEDIADGSGAPPYCGFDVPIAGTYFEADRLPDPSR